MPKGPLRLAVLAAALLAGLVPAAAAGRKLVLEDFFRGHLIAKGTFTNNWDGSHRDVRVDMRGHWDGQTLTLVEDFAYADGERLTKTWIFTKTGEGRYIGRREDVIGTASVVQDGDDVRLEYVARQAVKNGGTYDLTFHDRLVQTSARDVLNLADVGLLFFDVGRVELRIRRLGR
jgi:hypothetical protein